MKRNLFVFILISFLFTACDDNKFRLPPSNDDKFHPPPSDEEFTTNQIGEINAEQVLEDSLPLSHDDLKYVKRSELGHLRQLIKDKAHSSSWHDTYLGWLRQLIDNRRKCNTAYHDMYNGIEVTFRIFQGNFPAYALDMT